LEFAALIAVVVGALILMKVYMTRSFQGKYHSLADQIGSQYDPAATNTTSTDITHTTSSEYTAYDSAGNELGSVVVSNTKEDIDSTTAVHKD